MGGAVVQLGAARGVRRGALAAGMPGIVWAACLIGVVASSWRDVPAMFRPDPPLTLSEAAALRDHAQIVWLVQRGSDPNRASHVRAGVLRSDERAMTPLEAAIATRRVDTIALLIDQGALVHAGNYPALRCFAEQTRSREVIDFVASQLPSAVQPDCASVRTPW